MGNEEDDYGSYDSEYDDEYDSEEIELDHVTPSLKAKSKNKVTPNKVTPGKLVGKGPLGNNYNDEEYYDEEYDEEEEDTGPIRMKIDKNQPYVEPEVIKHGKTVDKKKAAKTSSQGSSEVSGTSSNSGSS